MRGAKMREGKAMLGWMRRALLMLVTVGVVTTGGFVVESEAEAACCSGRECTDDNLIICVLRGGNWTPLPCVPLLTCAITGAQGACCNPLLGCMQTTETLCFGTFMEGVSCDDIPSCRNLPPRGACCGLINSCSDTIEAGCDGFLESFAEGASCSDGICGLGGVQGACCMGSSCVQLPSVACFGSFHAGKSCAEVNQCVPPQVVGACCAGGTCTETTEDTCSANNGIFAAGVTCTADLCAIPEPEGACCTEGGACTESRESDCLVGSFQDGASCTDAGVCDHMIPPETGACCLGDQCAELTNAQCNAQGGEYNGDASSCANVVCELPPAEGACCSPNGCSEGPESECLLGTWHENTSCLQPGLCAPIPDVPCCNGYTCSMMSEEACTLGGGTPSPGGATTCSAGICGTPAGACCVNEQCTGDSAEACIGTFIETEECPAFDCTGRGILGGCCAPSGTCQDSTRAQCDRFGGTWGAETCDTRVCQVPEPEGACCEDDGCRIGTASSCSGTFSEGLTCGEVDCQVDDTGSCCSGSSCSVVTEARCLEDGGTFVSGGTCTDLAAECPSAERGACCGNGVCSNSSRFTCVADGGVFTAGANCDDDGEQLCGGTAIGNCCAENMCSELSEDDCVALAGTFLGDEPCDAETCAAAPLQGACCLGDEGCVQNTSDECEGLGGVWTESADCALVECDGGVSPPPADNSIGVGGGRLGSCASTGGAASALWALLLLGLVARTRRREERVAL